MRARDLPGGNEQGPKIAVSTHKVEKPLGKVVKELNRVWKGIVQRQNKTHPH